MSNPAAPKRWVRTNCPSGKRGYSSRRDAKKALEQAPLSHMRPYRCPHCPYWHNGHLPQAVLRGERTADQHYQPTPRIPETTMTTHVATLNATRDQIEEQLLAGKSPAEVVKDLQEPMPNVLAIFHDLRDEHRLPAANHPGLTGGPDGPPNPTVKESTTASISIFGEARAINNPRINRLAEKADAALTALHDAVTDHKSKAEARADVERLEAELRAARAKLISRPSAGGGSSKPRTATDDQQLECRKGCGRTSPTPQGRAAHERHCTHSAAA